MSIMAIIVQGRTYKSKRAFYETMHPEHISATQNDIYRYLYHIFQSIIAKQKKYSIVKDKEQKRNSL